MDIATFKKQLTTMIGDLNHETSSFAVVDAIEEACGAYKWSDMGKPVKMWVQLVDMNNMSIVAGQRIEALDEKSYHHI